MAYGGVGSRDSWTGWRCGGLVGAPPQTVGIIEGIMREPSNNAVRIGPVPFYGNTPDDKHCAPACIRMVLGYFLPERDLSWAEAEELVAFGHEKGAWVTRTLINLHRMGFEAVEISTRDGDAFTRDPEMWIMARYGEEAGRWELKYTDIPKEIAAFGEYVGLDIHRHRLPTLADLRDLIDDGYLLIPVINLAVLNGRDGFVGHAVVVWGYDDTGLWLHDPGLPALEGRHVEYELFESAWASPRAETKLVYGFRWPLSHS